MKLVKENINEKFEENSDPIKDMDIGFEAQLRKLQNRSTYVYDDDFNDDHFMLYVFKDVYDKWRKKFGSIKPDDIEIWEDTTFAGGSPIIKLSAPGIRETTIIRGDSAYYGYVNKDIINLLQSPKIKEKLSKIFNDNNEDPSELTNMIFTSGNRRKLSWSSIMVADRIANRLIKIFSK